MIFITSKIILYLTQVVALLVAIKHWNAIKNTSQKYFLHFMCYVVLHETSVIVLRYIFDIKIEILNNGFTIISFLFYYWWYHKILKRRKIIYVLLLIFIASFSASLMLEDLNKLWKYPLITGTFSILILVSILFSEILRDITAVNYLKSQKFWFSTGLLIFYIGFLPVLYFQNVVDTKSSHYGLIMAFLNVLLYGSFIIGFLCPPQKK